MTERLNFRVSSALKSVIGRDLITNDFVAIFELVKNSYDAGASQIDIIFHSDSEGMKKIIIADNGKGMSYDDIKNKWLFVAYSAKQDGTEDASHQKAYAGNKGVGRFSCDRLGGNLKLQSKVESHNSVEVIDVDWGAFEANSKDLFESVDIQHTGALGFNLPEEIEARTSGVVIEVTNLREPHSWDRQKLLRLKRHLAKLINPFGDKSTDFNIVVHSEREQFSDARASSNTNLDDDTDYSEVVNGPVRNEIFEVLYGKTTWLNVYIDETNHLISTLTDRGELIYKIKEPCEEYPELLDADFHCEIFYLNLSAKHIFKRRMSVPSVDFGSLFLFRNGFRVFPVGESGDDYWKVDRRRQQGYARYLGNRDIMGRVDIAGPEYKFKESSSRDKGLVETEASRQLYDCVVKKCIRRIESYVVGITWKDRIDKEYDTIQRLGIDENRSRIIDLVSALSESDSIELLDYNHELIDVLNEKSNYFESSIEQLSNLASSIGDKNLDRNIEKARKKFKELKVAEQQALLIADKELKARRLAEHQASVERSQRVQAEAAAQEATEAYEEVSEAYEDEKKRNLFLMSSESRDKEQLESFLHQIVIYASSSKQKIGAAIRALNKSSGSSNEATLNSLSELLENTEKIITTSRFATSANFKLDSREIEFDVCLYIQQYIEKICTAYNSLITINVESTANPFVIRFTPIELGMVLDNIVSNSKKLRASYVKFSIKDSSPGVLEIEITDDGRGLDSKILEPERIFEKGYTTTRGSGLGLYHSKNQVERMGGELTLPETQPAKGFKLLMRLRKK